MPPDSAAWPIFKVPIIRIDWLHNRGVLEPCRKGGVEIKRIQSFTKLLNGSDLVVNRCVGYVLQLGVGATSENTPILQHSNTATNNLVIDEMWK